MAYLTIRIKDVEGHTKAQLDQDRMVAGRQSDNEIPIKHSSISRQHCAFVREGDVWFLEDLGSANGTRVNNEKITGRVTLSERDIVKIGAARLTVHLTDQPAKSKPRKPAISGDDDGISLPADLASGPAAEVREAGIDDPAEAIPCQACGTWMSIAHRSPGERMQCPCCTAEVAIPQLVS